MSAPSRPFGTVVRRAGVSGRRGRAGRRVRFALETSQLEERCLMAVSDIMPAQINNPSKELGNVFFVGQKAPGPPPEKLITITNSSATRIVYPFLADSNIGGGVYDPFDDVKDTYRGYIGYVGADSKYHVGLKPHQSITVAVPLVFWNGGTGQVALANPLQDNDTWHYKVDSKAIAVTLPSKRQNAYDKGVVMWYHYRNPGAALEVAENAPAQLFEWTIRDPYLGKLGTPVPDTENQVLINYDVSYVNNLMLPVAMESVDNPVLENDAQKRTKAFGWTGAAYKISEMQKAIANFASDDPKVNRLGKYFRGKGYDKYFIGDPPGSQKTPAGYNFILNGPLNNVINPLEAASRNPHYMLVSGGYRYQLDSFGTGQISPGVNTISETRPDKLDSFKKFSGQLVPGMMMSIDGFFPAGTYVQSISDDLKTVTLTKKATNNVPPPNYSFTVYGSQTKDVTGAAADGGAKLRLTVPDSELEKFKNLNEGMIVTGPGVPTDGKLTLVKSVGAIDYAKNQVVVELSRKITPGSSGKFTFSGAVTDYLVSTLMDLWYSWANYFVDNANTKPAAARDGHTVGGDRLHPLDPFPPSTLELQLNDISDLSLGMVVTGNGIPTDGTTTTITAIDTIKNPTSWKYVVTLSQPAKTADGSYSFAAPKTLTHSDDVHPYKLTFSQDQAEMLKFAYNVYDVMTSFTNLQMVVPIGNGGSTLSPSAQVLAYTIGCNVGSFVDANKTPVMPIVRTVVLRDELKSLLRGVSDFLVIPEYDPKTGQSNWYPNPATPTPGAQINGSDVDFGVKNLNPYVYFVHRTLGLTGYGFSVDDDIANVGAKDATKLAVSIGGLEGLPNKAIYSYATQFGPVRTKGHINPAKPQKALKPTNDPPPLNRKITSIDPYDLAQVRGADPVQGPGAIVYGTGITPPPPVTTVLVPVVASTQEVVLNQDLDSSVAEGTYDYVFTGNPPPMVETAATATPRTARTAALSVLGSSRFYPESTLSYKWSMLSGPAGAKAVFTENDTNDAKTSIVTVDKAGEYTFRVTITDPGTLDVTSDAKVTISLASALRRR